MEKEFEKLILDKADVLLISEDEQDYQEMVEYGFKRVDYFNSYTIAEEYFKNHETQLDSYDLVLMGNFSHMEACMFIKNGFIEDHLYFQTFCNLGNVNKKYSKLFMDDHIKDVLIDFSLSLKANAQYHKIIHYLINKQSLPIKTTLPTVLIKPLPTFKKDLKILFLNKAYNDNIQKQLEKQGLNVDVYYEDLFHPDYYDLKKYDIIAITFYSNYFNKILNILNTAKLEQTGQSLTMLCAYNMSKHYVHAQRGYSQNCDEFSLDINFVGSDTKGQIKFGTKANSYVDCQQALIEGILNIYNEELKKLNQTGLQDYDMRNIEEVNQEHEELLRQEKEEGLIFDIANNSYDKLIQAVRTLNYQHIYTFDNLEIFSDKEKKEVTINMQYNNRTISSVTIPYYFDDDKIFGIQRLSNKGKLLPKEELLIYSYSCFEQDLPKKATMEELKIFNNIAKKVINKAQELPKEKPYERKYQKRRY